MKSTKAFRLHYGYAVSAALLTLVVTAAALFPYVVSAASNTELSQTINAGTLSTDIKDASRNTVASPAVGMSAISFPFECLVGGTAPTGTFGTNSERIYVQNPGAANNGWTLTLAATGGATSQWSNTGATQTYDYNDPTASGCTDGGDADSRAGQMTVDASGSTITTDCTSCTTANITKGASAAYSQAVVDSITLLNAASASDDYGRWYLTDVDMSQTIPAEQPADAYTLDLTLTVTAS